MDKYTKITRYHTYFGSFDDFGARCCKWKVDLPYINHILIREVLIGGHVLINDGYLVQLPAFREAIMDPKISPLKELVRCGWVKILTRNNGLLHEVPDEAADKGVTGFHKASKDKEYRKVLKGWSRELLDYAPGAFSPWPNFEIHVGYANTMALAQEQIENREAKLHTSQETIKKVFDMFNHEMARSKEAPRTKWEKIVSNLEKEGELKENESRDLMRLGNTTYHYNWGCCLTENHPELSVRVDTHGLNFFRNLCNPLYEYRPLPQKLPLPHRAEEKLKIGKDWTLLSDLVEKTANEAQQAKYKYLEDVQKYIDNPECNDIRKQSRKSADNYSKQLSKHFGVAESSKKAELGLNLFFLGASTTAGFYVGGPAGSFVGFLVGLAGVGTGAFPTPQVIEMYKTRDKRVMKFQKCSMEHSPFSPALKKDAVKKHMKDVPPYKE